MTTIDVTNNGITFNDSSSSTAQANGDALETIYHSTASNGDVVLYPFSSGDQLWVEESGSSGVNRLIDLDVNSGFPQNIVSRGQTDSNGEPLGEIIATTGNSTTYYLLELSVQGGLTTDFEHLRFDHNTYNSGQGGTGVLIRDQTSSASNDVTFFNCYFENAQDSNTRALEVNGVHWEYCTSDNPADNHCFSVRHRSTTNTSPRCTIKNCLASNAQAVSGGGYGINHSQGRCLVEDCVVLNCERGIKWGTDGTGEAWDVTTRRTRVKGCTSVGHLGLDEGNVNDATWTFEDVIFEDGGDHALRSGTDDGTYHVAAGSTLLLYNNGGNGWYATDGEVISTGSGAVIQACQNSNYGVNYQSSDTSTIETLRTDGNTSGGLNNNGNLTVTTHNTGTACDSDINGVPKPSDVGVGTQGTDTSGAPAAPTGFGIAQGSTPETEILATWTDASDNETGFEIQISRDLGIIWLDETTTNANIESYTIEDLFHGEQYAVRIRAVNDAGESEWVRS